MRESIYPLNFHTSKIVLQVLKAFPKRSKLSREGGYQWWTQGMSGCLEASQPQIFSCINFFRKSISDQPLEVRRGKKSLKFLCEKTTKIFNLSINFFSCGKTTHIYKISLLFLVLKILHGQNPANHRLLESRMRGPAVVLPYKHSSSFKLLKWWIFWGKKNSRIFRILKSNNPTSLALKKTNDCSSQ